MMEDDQPIDWRKLKAQLEAEDREYEVQAWLLAFAALATAVSCLFY